MPIRVFDLESLVGDIRDAMSWKILGPRNLVSFASTLRNDRNSLAATIAEPIVDRRREFRLFDPGIEGVLSDDGAILLNVSRSGLALGVRRKCAFARGEFFAVALRAGDTLVEIEGRVCWTRSMWHRDSPGDRRNGYFQAAGLAVASEMTSRQIESWRIFRECIQEGTTSLEMKISQL